MKKKWFLKMSLADDKYIAEADPCKENKEKRIKNLWTQAIACVLVLGISIGAVTALMPKENAGTDISKYKDSEYYEIIKVINEYSTLKNTTDDLWDAPTLDDEEGIPETDLIGGDDGEKSDSEITDNQVDGVYEGDKIKRSDTHIFYLDGATLRVYDIAGENTREVSNYTLSSGEKRDVAVGKWEFYLSPDAKSCVVILQYLDEGMQHTVGIVRLDLSELNNIKEVGRSEAKGSYITSRYTEKGLLVMCEYKVDTEKLDYANESTFLPQIDTGEGEKSILPKKIIYPDTIFNGRYTVVLRFDERSFAFTDNLAFLSYSEEIYVSADKIFLSAVYPEEEEIGNGRYLRNTMTKISAVRYDENEFSHLGDAVVRGFIKDRFSVNEKDGILSVVTTTNSTKSSIKFEDLYYASMPGILKSATGQSSASIYCISLDNFELIGSVEDFAPSGEEVYSVRFDGNYAYVCTAIEFSDPVYFFDLTSPENITYKETGNIAGFSTSLINLNGGYLLGIGRDENNDIKIEVYEESADSVVSVCSFIIKDADYSEEYKSYYVNREKNIFAFGIQAYGYGANSAERSRYVVLYFTGYELVEIMNVSLAGNNEQKRGVYIDGYMYVFGENDFAVEKIIKDAQPIE